MPYRCYVPRYNGNYDNEPKVRVFGFPSDNGQRKKWVKNIPRQNFQPSETSKVCRAHFRAEDIVTTISSYDENTGKIISANLDRPRCAASGAVLMLFPECPEYPSISLSTRESPARKKERLENRYLKSAILESINLTEEVEKKSVIFNFEG